MSVLKAILNEINNPYATIAKDGLICGDISGYIDTGIYTLNALVSGKLKGGFPKGKVVALAGEKGTGKTFILLNSIREYLNKDKQNEVVFFESEAALTKDMLIERGIDIKRVSIIPIATVEDLRNQSIKILDMLTKMWEESEKYPKVMFCLDSLGMLGTEHEQDTSRSNANKADMGKRAQLIKSVFRNITLKLSLLQIAMVITNHTYKGMGKFDLKKMSGGQGLEFAASIIIFLTKGAIKEDQAGSSKIKELVGNNINIYLYKGRLTIEGSKLTLPLDFKGGIGKYGGLLEYFVDAGIVDKAGAWYSYKTDRLGQGKEKAMAALETFLTDEMLDELQPYIVDKFCYGVYNVTQEVQLKHKKKEKK